MWLMRATASRGVLRKLVSTFGKSALSLSPTITTITRPALVRCCRFRGIKIAPSRSISTARPRTEELVKAAVQYFNISAEIRIADGGRTVPIAQVFFGHDVGTGMIYQDANIKVRAVENSHFAFHEGPAAGKHKSYAYRFETPDRVIVFTGDTGVSDAVTELAQDADLLVSETSSCQGRMQEMADDGRWQAMTPAEQAGITRQMIEGHMTLEEIGKMAASANVKTVVLSHLTHKRDGDYTSWAEEVKKHFSGQVLVAKDLMEF
jgi:ribonuclease BN (tRNA processing enzyme)